MNSAKAGIYFEPYFGSFVGGEMSGETFDEVHDSDPDEPATPKVGGNGYGARIGMDFINVAAGIDYMGANPTVDGDGSTLTNMGLFLAFKIPMFRFWAEYIFSAKLSAVDDDDNQLAWDKGTGTKIGFGYSPVPFFSINLEVISNTYTEFSFENEDGDDILEANNLDWKDHENKLNAYMLSLSIPI
jgi:hypothetical protein